jgi:hypothetical protein
MRRKTVVRVLGKSGETTGRNENARTAGRGESVDDRPHSVYEIVTRKMLEELKEDVGEVKGRVNTLLWLVAGAVVLEMVVRLLK